MLAGLAAQGSPVAAAVVIAAGIIHLYRRYTRDAETHWRQLLADAQTQRAEDRKTWEAERDRFRADVDALGREVRSHAIELAKCRRGNHDRQLTIDRQERRIADLEHQLQILNPPGGPHP